MTPPPPKSDRIERRRCLSIAAAAAAAALSRNVTAQVSAAGPAANTPPEGFIVDGLVTAAELAFLHGRQGSIAMLSGVVYDEVTIDEITFDRRTGCPQFIRFTQPRKRSRPLKVGDVYRLRVADRVLGVKRVAPIDAIYLRDENVAKIEATKRLSELKAEFRELPTEEQRRAGTERHLERAHRAVEKLAGTATLSVVETDSLIVLTSLPAAATRTLAGYAQSVDKQLNPMFGFPVNADVWHGKPMLALFADKRQFAAFEERIMDNPNHGGRPGIRWGDGTMMRTLVVEKMEPDVAWRIVWGYAGGRYSQTLSDARGFRFLWAGISDVVAYALVPKARDARKRRRNVAKDLKANGTLYGMLTATDVPLHKRELTAELTQYLATADAAAFAGLVQDSKLGFTVDEAFKRNYNVTPGAIARSFGRSLGAAGVTA